MAEALTVREALFHAAKEKLYSDSQTLIKLINTRNQNIEIYEVLQDLEFFSLDLQIKAFGYVERVLNVEVDFLAKSALISVLNYTG